MKVVYMCRPEFENGGGGLKERPSLKMGGFQNRSTRETVKKGVLELKITKKHIFLLKRRIFSSCAGRKSGVFRSCQGQKWGAFGGHIPYCPNMGVCLPPHHHHPHTTTTTGECKNSASRGEADKMLIHIRCGNNNNGR